MANVFNPFGLREFGSLEGGTATRGLTRRFLGSTDSNLYFTGDVVSLSSAATANGNITQYNPATATSPLLGVFAGCEYFSAQVGRQVFSPHFLGSSNTNVSSGQAVTAFVIEGEDVSFLCQFATLNTNANSSNPSTVVGATVIGMNVSYFSTGVSGQGIQANGNQTTGISALCLASTTISAASSLPFRIVDFYANCAPPGINGGDLSTPGAIVVVSFNNQNRRSLTGLST